jgi:hypothetical protein
MTDYLISSAIHTVAFLAISVVGMFIGALGHQIAATVVICGVYTVSFWAMGLAVERWERNDRA